MQNLGPRLVTHLRLWGGSQALSIDTPDNTLHTPVMTCGTHILHEICRRKTELETYGILTYTNNNK